MATMLVLSRLVESCVLWCIHFNALDLEFPFGTRVNDLPMDEMQQDWNKSICTLLDKRAQRPPKFFYEPVKHDELSIAMSDAGELYVPDSSPVKKRRRAIAKIKFAKDDVKKSIYRIGTSVMVADGCDDAMGKIPSLNSNIRTSSSSKASSSVLSGHDVLVSVDTVPSPTWPPTRFAPGLGTELHPKPTCEIQPNVGSVNPISESCRVISGPSSSGPVGKCGAQPGELRGRSSSASSSL